MTLSARLYKTVPTVILLLFQCSLLISGERYGGVEIGAKGIKTSAIDIDLSGPEPRLTLLELDKKTVDVTLSRLKGKKFEAVLIDDAADVVKDFIQVLTTQLGVPEANIQVVASSGVPFATNFADLITAVRERTGKSVDKIDADEESALTFMALVPRDHWAHTVLVDVGSGNTKGGEFVGGVGPGQFVALELPLGTATFSKKINDEITSSGDPRAADISALGKRLAGDHLSEYLTKTVAAPPQNKKVLIGGGAVWAFVTIMKPETALSPFTRFTAADVKAYSDLLQKSEGGYPRIDFSQVADAAARKAAEADYDRICGTAGGTPVFKPEELQAGAALLSQLSDSLEFSQRAVFFDRKAVTAWITTRITPVQQRHLLPQALGRNVRLAANAAAPQVASIERFGGVEIGAKGIKASAIELDTTNPEDRLRVLELDKKTVEVTISRLKGKKFEAVLIDDAADVVKDFIQALTAELKVPEANIQVVASSGVPFANNFAALVAAVRQKTGKLLDKIDAKEEAALTFMALIPRNHWTHTLLLDIGSGNTKGGEFPDDRRQLSEFSPIEIPVGTATLSKAIDEEVSNTGAKRYAAITAVSKRMIADPLRQLVPGNAPGVPPKKVLIGGGAVWAFVTIMKPETALSPFTRFTSADVKAYSDLLQKSEGGYPRIDFSQVADAAARKAAEADYDRICGTAGGTPVFKPEELQAGAALLSQLSDSLEFSQRAVFFDRKAVTAWITTRITPVQQRHLLPQALGRNVAAASSK